MEAGAREVQNQRKWPSSCRFLKGRIEEYPASSTTIRPPPTTIPPPPTRRRDHIELAFDQPLGGQRIGLARSFRVAATGRALCLLTSLNRGQIPRNLRKNALLCDGCIAARLMKATTAPNSPLRDFDTNRNRADAGYTIEERASSF